MKKINISDDVCTAVITVLISIAWWLLLFGFVWVLLIFTGCATAGTGGQRGVVNVVNRSDTTTTTLTNGPTNIMSVSNASQQGFIKPRWSLFGLIFGDSPMPTAVPSGYSVQNGQPVQQVVVVESPYPYGYPYGYGYGSPYRSMYSGYGSSEKRLFGYRFRSR